MRNKIAIIALLAAMMLLAGCDGTTTTGGDPFLGGSAGVTLEFMEDAPPGEVFDGGDFPFSIVVMLENAGEWDVPAGKAELSINGVNPAEYGVSDGDMVITIDEPLEGSTKDAEGNVIPGTIIPVEFPEMVYEGELVGNRLYPIRANLCYEYGTRATSTLCVRSDLRDNSETPVCTVNEDKDVASSGAPVAVTTFQEAVAGSEKVRFSFTVSHKQDGNIYQLGSGCDGSTYSNRDKVKVTVDSGLEGLQCTGLGDSDTSGFITLSGEDGERVITCTQPLDAQTDYEQPVNIVLEYDYKDYTSTTLLVKHTGE